MSISTVELLDKLIMHIITFLETDIPTKHIFSIFSLISATFVIFRLLHFVMCDVFYYNFSPNHVTFLVIMFLKIVFLLQNCSDNVILINAHPPFLL